MKYELGTLEHIIENYFNHRDKDVEQEIQRDSAIQFEKEVDRIENVFLGLLFLSISEQMRKRYIRHHQQRLQYMEEKIHQYTQTNSIWLKSVDATGNYEVIQKAVDRLLSVIETHYGTDMLMNSVAPFAFNKEMTENLISSLPDLEHKLDVLKIDRKLSGLLVKSFEQFSGRDHYHLSCYGQLHMIRQIVQDILNHEPSAGLEKMSEQNRWLIELLCSYNFNRLSFYAFCKDWIIQYFSPEEDKLYLYTRCGKFFSRLSVKKGWGWNLQRMEVTSMLADYFRDSFLAEKRRMQQEMVLSQSIEGTGKLFTNLTVEQLGLFIKLMCNSEIVKSKSVTSSVRFFARHISTVGKDSQQDISYDYLKSAYNRSSLQVIDKVDSYLQEMSSLLRQIRIAERKSFSGKP